MGKDVTDPARIIGDLFDLVEQYRQGSAALDGLTGLFYVNTQIRGQLVELALKTYLAAGGEYVTGHNLMDLAERCRSNGLLLTDPDSENIIENLHRRYYYDSELDWAYGSRYPMEDRPTVVWIGPSHSQVDEFVLRVINQAREQKNDACPAA